METYSPFSVSMGQALWVIIVVAGPLLILMLVVGLIISMIQAATSISEQTVSFVPKLLAIQPDRGPGNRLSSLWRARTA